MANTFDFQEKFKQKIIKINRNGLENILNNRRNPIQVIQGRKEFLSDRGDYKYDQSVDSTSDRDDQDNEFMSDKQGIQNKKVQFEFIPRQFKIKNNLESRQQIDNANNNLQNEQSQNQIKQYQNFNMQKARLNNHHKFVRSQEEIIKPHYGSQSPSKLVNYGKNIVNQLSNEKIIQNQIDNSSNNYPSDTYTNNNDMQNQQNSNSNNQYNNKNNNDVFKIVVNNEKSSKIQENQQNSNQLNNNKVNEYKRDVKLKNSNDLSQQSFQTNNNSPKNSQNSKIQSPITSHRKLLVNPKKNNILDNQSQISHNLNSNRYDEQKISPQNSQSQINKINSKIIIKQRPFSPINNKPTQPYNYPQISKDEQKLRDEIDKLELPKIKQNLNQNIFSKNQQKTNNTKNNILNNNNNTERLKELRDIDEQMKSMIKKFKQIEQSLQN